MITVLEQDPAFLREIEAFARGLAMYATEEDFWAGFNENWDCYIWWDEDSDTYHACVYPVIGGEIDMSQSMQLNLGDYIGQDRRKKLKEVDVIEVWTGDFEFVSIAKGNDPDSFDGRTVGSEACIVHSIRAKTPMPRDMMYDYVANLNCDWLVPTDFKGEILWKTQ